MSFVAAAIGAGGAVSLGVIGTSMSEGIPNAMNMGAIWLVLLANQSERAGRGALRRYAVAGALVGGAVVLKSTMAPYVVGFATATLAVGLLDRRLRVTKPLAAAGFSAALVGAVFGVPWFLAVFRAFGNPLFPYYNAVFHTPLWFDANFIDTRFLPKNLYEWVFYPLEWTLRKSRKVSEEPVRDLRILLGLLSAAAHGQRRAPAG